MFVSDKKRARFNHKLKKIYKLLVMDLGRYAMSEPTNTHDANERQ